MSVWRFAIVVWGCAMVATFFARRLIIHWGWFDHPNARSSHVAPTPRGGGVAIVLVTLGGTGFLMLSAGLGGRLSPVVGVTVLLGGAAIALLGLVDDRRGLTASWRLRLQALTTACALTAIGGLAPVPVGEGTVDYGWLGHVLAWPALIWFVNLYNFMDGIDGIAASEAVFVSLSAAWLTACTGAPPALTWTWVLVGGASLGFLPFNWAPARLFMGDVGSGFLGYVIAVLLVVSGHLSGLSLWTAIILTAPFFADATVTLARRVARQERWNVAHRSHAYQHLARRLGSHAKVTALLMAVNVCVILPIAWYSVQCPARAGLMTAAVILMMASAAWLLGAGTPESSADDSNQRKDST